MGDDWGNEQLDEIPQAARLAQYLARKHPQQRILDVGCGRGFYVDALRAVGMAAFGVDADPRLQESSTLVREDVTAPPWRSARFTVAGAVFLGQVVLSLEVGEHIESAKAHRYIDYLRATGCEVIYFSAAHPGQGGTHHVNCQPRSYWAELLHGRGYFVDPEAIDEWLGYMRQGPHMGWLLQNGMVFRKATRLDR